MDDEKRRLIKPAVDKSDDVEDTEEENTEDDQENDSTALVKANDEVLGIEKLKQGFSFLNLPANRFGDLELTQKQAARLRGHIQSLKTGTYAVLPLICGGLKCPFVMQCPLSEFNDKGEVDAATSVWPVLTQCPVESAVLAGKIADLAREYDVQEEDITDIAIISKIAELDVYDHRLSYVLAKDEAQNLLREDISHIDEQGRVYTTLRVHPALDAKEKIAKQRERLVRDMLGTRAIKMKMIGRDTGESDEVKAATKLATVVRALLKQNEDEDAIEVEYEEMD